MLALLSVLLAPLSARAALLGDTQSPFTAQRTVIVKGKSYTGPIWAAPGEQRHEQVINGLHLVAIIRADRNVTWLILPDLHVYAELPLRGSWLAYADSSELQDPQPGGSLAGDETRKYLIRKKDGDGSTLKGAAWLGAGDRLVKMDGVYTAPHGHTTAFNLELSHIRSGPQSASLFELPGGMSRLPAGAIEPLLGFKG